jgi:hypothetical protein
MCRLLEHRGESEELARRRLIYYDLLVILVHGRDMHVSAQENIGLTTHLLLLIYALARSKGFELHLGSYKLPGILSHSSVRLDGVGLSVEHG